MSRNTEYQFVSTSTETLEALLVAGYEKITGVSVKPASPEKLFIQWVTSIVLQERVLNNYTGNQNLPSRAEGSNLDSLGELFYVTQRPTAQAAVCTERFYISQVQTVAVLIPSGTRVTDASSTLVWATTADAYIAIGSTYADVAVRCQTSGAVGNGYAAGQINTIVDLFDYYDHCENITASDDGLNAAGGSDSSTQGFSIAAGTSADGETPQLTISGGTLYVNASGDGLDSNGDLTVTGGEIYVDGPTNGGNGALDYGEGCTAAITGGTVVAAGASGMAVGFGDSSTQCSMLVIFDSTIAGGTELTVTDSSGKVVLAYTPSKDYQTAVISSSALTKGSVYTVAAGDISAQITLSGVSSTSGTQSNGMGGPQSGNSQNSGTVFDRDSGSSASGDTKSGPPDGGGPQGGPSGGPKERGSSNSAGGQTSDSGTT